MSGLKKPVLVGDKNFDWKSPLCSHEECPRKSPHFPGEFGCCWRTLDEIKEQKEKTP